MGRGLTIVEGTEAQKNIKRQSVSFVDFFGFLGGRACGAGIPNVAAEFVYGEILHYILVFVEV